MRNLTRLTSRLHAALAVRFAEWPATRIVLAALASTLLVAIAPLRQAQAQTVAVLLEASAGATVSRAGRANRAGTLQPLNVEDELQVPAQGRAVLLWARTGDEFVVEGSATVRIEATAPAAVIGAAAVRRTVPAGREVRVSPVRLVQGGVVLRDSGVIPRVAPEVIEQRRPPGDAPFHERVAYGLWLEEVNAVSQAQAWWRTLAAERPDEPALAAKAAR